MLGKWPQIEQEERESELKTLQKELRRLQHGKSSTNNPLMPADELPPSWEEYGAC